MKIRVLGASGAKLPNHPLSSILIDEKILIDAGTICQFMDLNAQLQLETILITHIHFDHIADLPLLADNLVGIKNFHSLKVISSQENINYLKLHIFNNIIWPDFTKIPNPDNPVLNFLPIQPYEEFKLLDYTFIPIPVEHSVYSVGYLISKDDKSIFYTGDLRNLNTKHDVLSQIILDALFIEVSFPSSMETLAEITKHLTPQSLSKLLRRHNIKTKNLFINHLKPPYASEIYSELRDLLPQAHILQPGEQIEI